MHERSNSIYTERYSPRVRGIVIVIPVLLVGLFIGKGKSFDLGEKATERSESFQVENTHSH